MACKLYYQSGDAEHQIGTFQNIQKAQRFWKAIKPSLAEKLGTQIKPIFVMTGKGRGK